MIQSIERAIQALAGLQSASGEWTTYRSYRMDMADATICPVSPYATGFVIHGLALLQGMAATAPLLAKAEAFLRSIQSPNGGWNYEGPAGDQLPQDLDDTSVAAAALLLCGQRPSLATYRLLWENEVEASGPYYTWVGVNHGNSGFARELDPLVNANIAWFAGLAGLQLPNLAAFLRQCAATNDYSGQFDQYTTLPHLVVYSMSRAATEGGMDGLASIHEPLRRFVLEHLPPNPNPYELASSSIILLNAGASDAEISPYLEPLIAAQQPDGSWPLCAGWVSFHRHYDGSPALTTALAIEALWKWQQRSHTSG